MERVLASAAMRGRVGEWTDSLEQLGPSSAVRHDQWQRSCVRLMDEVNVQPVDLGLELRQRVQSRRTGASLLGRPVAREFCIAANCTPTDR
jgi:hypothetical protein